MTENEANGVIYILRELEELQGLKRYLHEEQAKAYEESLNVAIAAVEQKYGLSLEDE